MTARRTIGALLLAAVLALTGCGRDEGGGGDGAAQQSAAITEGPATGEITVWAMGTEGELLPKLAEAFQKDNPDATVKVTAVPWDGAHDKIATAIAGRQTPDVSLIGTTWMGEFAGGGGLDPVPANLLKAERLLRGRLGHGGGRRDPLRDALVHRHPASCTTARTWPPRPGSRPRPPGRS